MFSQKPHEKKASVTRTFRINAQWDDVISEEDMEFLKNVDQIKDYGSASMWPVYGGKLG